MTRKTRYFVIASLLMLTVGLGAGLVAYFVGFPTAFAQQGPDELQLVPSNATLVAYANVHEVMVSNLRERLRQAMPNLPDGQGEFENHTGINIETDIDRVVAALVPAEDGTIGGPAKSGLIIASGRFDRARIEGLMRDHGASEEVYKGRQILVAAREGDGLSMAFIDAGLVALGSTPLVRRAIDLTEGGENVRNNAEIMDLVQSLERGNVWAVGRFDALRAQANLPARVVSQLPPLTSFAVSGRVNGGLLGEIRAQLRDEESANEFRDVVRGVIALGKLQADSHPELEIPLRSLQLGGSGTTVALSFELPAEVIDLLARPRADAPVQ